MTIEGVKMNKSRLVLILAVLVLLASVLACGGNGTQAPTIEMAAAEVNFTAADLGGDWSLQADQGVDEIQDISEEDVLDANMRMFASSELTGMVMSIVFTTESVAAAKQEMKGNFVNNMKDEFQAGMPDVTFETLDPPAIGEEAAMVGGNYADLAMNIYMLVFRKANVIVMFVVTGAEDGVTEDLIGDYAQRIEAKIQ
jgi:hypothetical protein